MILMPAQSWFCLRVFFVFIIPVVQSHAADIAWKKYVNERFGYSLEYPAALVASPDPFDKSGREYHTPDSEFSVATAAHYLRIVDPNESLDSNWKDDVKDLKKLITYKKKSDSWYVISGVTTNGYVFYYKFFTQGNNWATFHIIYPKSQKTKYDPWVTRIEKHFVPFLKGKYYERSEWKGAAVK
jgi:outer membrane receptor protein involved in Fe transport